MGKRENDTRNSLVLIEHCPVDRHVASDGLFVEETAKGASGTTLTTLVWVVVVLVFLVLDEVFSDTAHDGTTDRSQNTVVCLVTGETTGETTGKGTA